MAAQVLSFFQRSPRLAPQPMDWSQQELAEFYRVESALIRAGIRVGTDRGLSDENEPWFVFYRNDDGEVVIHFARIDGEYVIAGPAYEEIARGFDFSSLVRNLVARHPLIQRSERGGNLSIHPAALLVAIVGTAFFKTGEARAAESGASNGHSGHAPAASGRPALLSSSSASGVVAATGLAQPAYDTIQLPVSQAVLVLAAAMMASDYRVDQSSLSTGSQTAISAAAASLDFGDVRSTSVAAGEGAHLLGTAPASATAENGSVQTVSSVLSLVALLSTLPQHSDAQTGTESLAGLATPAHTEAPQFMSLGASDASDWTLQVKLDPGLGGLPGLEAVALVREAIGGSSSISVIQVSKLPDVLADIIAKGAHVDVVPPTTAPQTDTHVTTPITPTEPTPPATSTGSSGQTDHSSGGDTITVPPPSTSTSNDPTPPATPSAYASVAIVQKFIDYFIAHTTKIEIMHDGVDIVMFDTRALHNPGTIGQLDSMTFHFADHTSISLVGDHSAFLNDGIMF